MKKGKEKTFVRSVTEIATESGEVIRESKLEVAQFESEPPYVKLYLQDIGRLNGLTSTEQRLVYVLVHNMGWNNVVPAYKPIKEEIAKSLGVSYNTIEAAIKGLTRKGILIRRERGFYYMNPYLFGRGSWKDIKEIRLTIEYKENKRVLNTSISKQLDLFEQTKLAQ